MRKSTLLLLACFWTLFSYGQKPGKAGVMEAFDEDLYEAQLGLTELMYWSQYGDSTFERNDANYLFIRDLVRALRMDGAFDFPFDSLRYISKLYAPDRSFRLFTWQVKQDFGTYRHFGCILMNDDERRIIPLIDQSNVFIDREDTSLSHKSWYGAAYFQIVPEVIKSKGIRYYTLIGYDPHELFSQRKMVDVLWFDKEGTPFFGAPLFVGPEGVKYRHIIEYAGDVIAQMRFDPEVERIIFDNLFARNPENAGFGFDDVPDGSFNAYILKKRKWIYESNADLRMRGGSSETAPPPKKSGLLPE